MEATTKSFYDYFQEFAQKYSYKRLYFTEKFSYSVKQTFNITNALAAELNSYGIKAGSVVALRCTRSVDTVLLLFALQTLGALAVLTDPHSGVEEFIKNSGVDITVEYIISNEKYTDTISSYGGWELFWGNEKTAEIKIPQPDEKCEKKNFNVNVYAPAIIIFTSGSMGKSKGVVLSQYNYLNHTLNYAPQASYKADDVAVEVLPLHHVFGLAHVINPILEHYEVFFPEAINYEYVTECIGEYKLTRIDGVPSYLYAMAEYAKNSGLKIKSLRVGVIGGAPLSIEQFNYIESALGLKLLPVYGMSECIGIAGAGENELTLNRATSVGKFLPMHKYFILDDNNKILPQGEEGEICIKSPVVALGYYNNSEETLKIIDSHGRLHTGDLGYVDENGFLHISGRKKDVIIRHGNNLSALDIERKILTLPQVKDVCVVGVSDEKAGEIPCALIVGELVDLTEVLTKIELPAKVLYAKAIPLTSSGKPDKQKIIRLFT